ncbi:helix-turn-helix domain-containing protein [Actinomadura xylanilytica]|uniref:helix-turn-helix domain-containing protein n=1 Tax=Actinomadura xylanilytica TaxID=887459 RepID=UPI00255AFFDE|nr:helix-turn-helix transcriptional regulator [Actinomadura xylanilytica]MDL4777592.1 helix-turn-helix transcriptional regulator [Actinomadura xylanilytica]
MTPLRAQREQRGWSKTQLDVRLRSAAKRRGEALPQAQSLARQIARWENGHGAVSELYQQLFCEVYGCSPVELGFVSLSPPAAPDHESPDEFTLELARASSVDAEVAKLLQAQTDGIRALDARQGAQLIHGQMRAHIAHVEELNRHAVVPGVRGMLAKVLADTSALAGWQALDVGTLGESWRHFERAKSAAREAEDPSLLAFATAEQAYVLLDLGNAEQAAELVGHARRQAAGKVPSLMSTWLAAAHAETAAALHDADAGAVRRTLDEAAGLLPTEPDEHLPYLVLNESHLARWRGNCFARLGDADVIEDLSAGLVGVDGTFARAEAGVRIDLATALLVRGERGPADEHLRAARVLASRTGSLRQKRRIDLLVDRMRHAQE